MNMDGLWRRPGQAKIVSRTDYGDTVVTSGGCIFFELFGGHHGAEPDCDEPDEMVCRDEIHGGLLKKWRHAARLDHEFGAIGDRQSTDCKTDKRLSYAQRLQDHFV